MAISRRIAVFLLAAGCACLAALWFRQCAGARADSVEGRPAPILMYHHVGDALTNRWWVPAAEFEAHLRHLRDNGYESVLPSDLKAAAEGRGALPARPVVLTFDDGGLDLLTFAEPIMARHGFTGVIYLISGRVGSGAAGRMEYEGQPCLTWPEARAMRERGNFRFGGHTRNSPDLRRAPDLDSEIQGCRDDLARELGAAPDSFSYPFGRYRSNVVEAVGRAGFETAVTCEPKVFRIHANAAWLELPRVNVVGGAGLEAFERALSQSAR